MSSPTTLATVYATDENVACRAPGDYFSLCPKWQKIAYGIDGVISSGNLWVLTSTSCNFTTRGIAVGNVFLLDASTPTYWKGSGELFAVGAVSGTSLTLRRLGLADGAGEPPSPSSGLTAIRFTALTMSPQIEEVSFDINRAYNIDPASSDRSPSDLYDLRDLRSLAVLMVLKRLYLIEARGSKDSDFALKLKEIEGDLDDVSSRVTLRWGSDPETVVENSFPTMRISRG